MKNVAIVGAGCSGLTAIKSCLEENLTPVCYERSADIGGLWNYSDSVRRDRASIYKNLVINTSKEMMAFSDFPIPEDFPPFLPHQNVLKYFRMYADNFKLLEHVVLKTTVLRICKTADYDSTGRWEVTVVTEGEQPTTKTFDGVMVCSGHHSVPYTPKFKGDEGFEGLMLHSHDYKESTIFTGKNVLIVGMGNSAVDIAVDASRVANKVMLSTRRGAWVIGRTGFWGLPADLLANSRFIFSLPMKLLQWVVQKQANFKVDHGKTGLKPEHGATFPKPLTINYLRTLMERGPGHLYLYMSRALEAHPTINDELPFRLLSGKVTMKPNIRAFTQDGVEFDDNTQEQIDVVIFATGYDYRLDFVDEDIVKIENNETELYKFMYPPNLAHHTFAVIGLVQPVGAMMPISEIQCRWFTRVIKGEASLPSKPVMKRELRRRSSLMDTGYVKSRRHSMQTMWIDYMDDIASKIGAKPEMKSLLLKDPSLALQCYFGPCVPAQYRLNGPGKWKGARPIIIDAVSRSTKGATRREVPDKKDDKTDTPRNSGIMWMIYASVFVVIMVTLCLDRFQML